MKKKREGNDFSIFLVEELDIINTIQIMFLSNPRCSFTRLVFNERMSRFNGK